MKIAFLNPWRHAAENQAFRSLQTAATRIGHELVQCCNSDDVDTCRPDFVLASASTQPKLSDFPHYGTIHEPRDRFLTNRGYYRNLLTYDGYLTISDSLARFLGDLNAGLDRFHEVGFYYNTCQRQDRATDLCSLIKERKLVLTYFGTNWDRRRSKFFKLLSNTDAVQICGPAHSWPEINPKSYGGEAAFDGDSVQAKYAANGIGLCLLSDLHLRDDVISNRIFEITSVGALAICCDIPWIRKHFGDSVYYIDQNTPDRYLVGEIGQRVNEIYADPQAAIAKAKAARKIFDEKFAAEVLLENAVTYHRSMVSRRSAAVARAKTVYEPFISVIIRCGGRSIPFVRRAIESVARQTYGNFEIILSRYRDLDVQPLLDESWPNLRSITVVNAAPGGRSTSLWAGLTSVTGEYFAVLDDDDSLFSTHFEELFRPFPSGPQERYFAYAGSISEHADAKEIMGGGSERRELFRFGIEPGSKITDISGAFASNCFVASSDLLHASLLQDPGMCTAEDSFLILSLLAQTEPRFSFGSTSVHGRGTEDQSRFHEHPRRFDDLLTLHTRLVGKKFPQFSDADGWPPLQALWSRRAQYEALQIETRADRIVHRAPQSRTSMMDAAERDCLSTGFHVKGSRLPKEVAVDAGNGALQVRCPSAGWGYGAVLRLRGMELGHGEGLIVVEVKVEEGAIGVGLLTHDETNFVLRRLLKPDPRVQEVHVPVPDFAKAGRLVVQNWEHVGNSLATLLSVRVFA